MLEKRDAYTQTPSRRIMCIGMCVIDFIHVCETYPKERHVTKSSLGAMQRGGTAPNMCTILRCLGAKCEFMGIFSKNPIYNFVHNDFRTRGIDICNCMYISDEPPIATVIVAKAEGTCTRIPAYKDFPSAKYDTFKDIDLSRYAWIHFEDNDATESILMMRNILAYNTYSTEQIIVSVTLETLTPNNALMAELADYVFFGRELAKNMGWTNFESAVHNLRNLLQNSPNVHQKDFRKPAIICSWGRNGVNCLDYDDSYTEFKYDTVEIVDPMGASETFSASMIYALLILRLKLKSALKFAKQCVNYKLGFHGYNELGEFMQYLKNNREMKRNKGDEVTTKSVLENAIVEQPPMEVPQAEIAEAQPQAEEPTTAAVEQTPAAEEQTPTDEK